MSTGKSIFSLVRRTNVLTSPFYSPEIVKPEKLLLSSSQVKPINAFSDRDLFKCIATFKSSLTEVSKNKIDLEIRQPDVRSKSDDTFTFSQPTKPIVLLFGWAGASHKNVAKYASIYQSAGCTTVQYILPSKYIFTYTELVPQLMKNFLLTLNEQEDIWDRPVYLHILSDTGMMCYQGLELEQGRLKREESNNESLNIKGVVFDSCPGPYPEVDLRGVLKFLLVNLYCCSKDKMSIKDTLESEYRLLVDRGWPGYLRNRKGLEVELSKMEGVWCGHFGRDHSDLFPNRQELFLFSDFDFYLPSNFVINEVLKKRFDKGIDTSFVRFKGSHHVQHLRKHKELYKKSILNFLQETVEGKYIVETDTDYDDEKQKLPAYLVRKESKSSRSIGLSTSFGN